MPPPSRHCHHVNTINIITSNAATTPRHHSRDATMLGIKSFYKLILLMDLVLLLKIEEYRLTGQRKPEGQWTSNERKASNLDSDKITTGYVFTVGGTVVSWMSKIQKCVTMSTIEAEYMAIAVVGKELNPVFHGRTKHIKIRYQYIRELVSEWTLSLKKILGAKNPTDMLTKVVTTKKLKLCAVSTGLRDNWKVRAVALLKGIWFEVYRDYLRQRPVK
ncbi:hypothetical protein Tco_1227468 [Tanacetum coccineum]